MLNYDDTINQLEEMRIRYDDGFSVSDRALLENLNQIVFGKVITKTGCSDCYRDAYILIYNKLKALGEMPTPSNYKLKAGMLIHTFNSPNFYTLEIPDEVAEDYLRTNPSNIREFQRYPADWEERIKKNSKQEETIAETKVEEESKEEEPNLFDNASDSTTTTRRKRKNRK